MTLQLRPTFSESWYRVKDLAPRLRPTAQITRQHFRGERWYVVRDAAGNQFHRLSDAAYRFVGLLDGSRTVGEAWELVGGQLADEAPTQPEVIQILSQLYAANLIQTDVSPDAQVLLRRHKKQQQKKMQGRLMNLLFPRMPIWDPDRFLKQWMPLMRPLLSTAGLLLWVAVVVAAIIAVIPEGPRLAEAASNAINLKANPENAFWLYAVFVLIKLIHELGHGFFCRRFGGEVHELGLMLLVLIPCPYVDASTSWGFQSKWHRALVSSGGMIFELFVAALCAFVWLNTNPTTLINQLAYNAMLIASVSTVLFNANPLLRYDGYYILSDLWEIPNLQQKSTEYALGLVKRHVFRVKSQQPLPPIGQRVRLFCYAIASSVYRVFISIAIMLMVLFHLPEEVRVLGLLMGAGAVATFFIVPAYKLFKYLTIEPELHRKRGRAWAFTLGVAAAVVVLVGIIPWPQRVRAEAVTQPEQRSYVRVGRAAGFVQTVLVKDGDDVTQGQAILRLSDPKLDAEIQGLEAQMGGADLRLRASSASDPAQRILDLSSRAVYANALADAQKRKAALVLRSPIAGRLISPNIQNLPGQYLKVGQEVATVDQRGNLIAYVPIGQADAQLLMAEGLQQHAMDTEIRLSSDPAADPIYALQTRLSPAADQSVRSRALLYAGGGQLAPSPEDKTGKTSVTQQYELRVVFANADDKILPDQHAFVRVTLDKKPLIQQWTRKLLQLIQSTSTNTGGAAGMGPL